MKAPAFLLPLFLCVFGGVKSVAAQAAAFPLDSVTQKVTYKGIVAVPGATPAKIIANAKEWAAATGDAQSAPRIDALSDNSLLVVSYTRPKLSSGALSPYRLRYSCKIEAKDGRYKYTFTDWQRELDYNFDAAKTARVTKEQYTQPKPLESFFASTGNRVDFDSKGRPRPAMRAVIAGLDAHINALVQSLKTAETASAQGKNW